MKKSKSISQIELADRALSELRIRLRFADAVYAVARARKNLEGQQWAVGQAIAAAAQFADCLAEKPSKALYELLGAWCDLEDGHADAIIKPATARSGQKVPLSEAQFRFYAAVAMEQYFRGGLRRDDAASRVATKLSNKGYRFRRSGRAATPTEQVKHWRDSPRVSNKRLAEHVSATGGSMEAGDFTIIAMTKLFPQKFETDTASVLVRDSA